MEEIGIESTLVEAIRNGDKTIEAHLGKPRFLRMNEGDIISIREDFWYEGEILESLSHSLEIKITQILYFETFKEMLNAVDFQAAIPSAKTIEDALKTYAQFYSPEDEREYGVVALFFEPLQTTQN
jgi:ASC-1-like (ASCH) protein